jgi:hypothetical protein
MQAGMLRQIARTICIQAVPIDGSRPGHFIAIVLNHRINDAEAHVTDGGKRVAGSVSHGTVELRLGHGISGEGDEPLSRKAQGILTLMQNLVLLLPFLPFEPEKSETTFETRPRPILWKYPGKSGRRSPLLDTADIPAFNSRIHLRVVDYYQ